MRPSGFRPLLLAFAALPLAILAASCGKALEERAQAPVPVTVAQTARKTVPVTFRAIGHVEPIQSVDVRARIGGELTKVWFAEGQPVRAGDTLFTIDPRPYETALRQAEAQLDKDQPLLRKAEEDVKRYADLVKKDFVTQEQYDLVIASAESLKASVAEDQARVDDARLQLAYCTIRAPVSARTGNLVVKMGNLVKANDDTPLVTLNQTRPIYVRFSVPAQLLPAIRQRDGDRVKVTATVPGAAAPPSEGRLSFVDNVVDTTSGTILLKATFPNPDEALWPGQFVDVVVTLGEEPDRVVAPSVAVQSGQQGQYVFVVKPDSTVEMRPIKVARMDESEAVVAEGLAAGETVVTDGQIRLAPGTRVEIRKGESPGATPS